MCSLGSNPQQCAPNWATGTIDGNKAPNKLYLQNMLNIVQIPLFISHKIPVFLAPWQSQCVVVIVTQSLVAEARMRIAL